MKSIINDMIIDSDVKNRSLRRYLIEWHRKFSLSFACLILFYWRSLGAIVRRGGIGLPVIFSVLLFLVYHVISITGEKFEREVLFRGRNVAFVSRAASGGNLSVVQSQQRIHHFSTSVFTFSVSIIFPEKRILPA
jgi:hypothetical protein